MEKTDQISLSALVVGGTGGLGRECVKKLIESKVDVVFTYFKNQKYAQQLTDEMQEKFHDCKLNYNQLDLSDETNILNFVSWIKEGNLQFNMVIYCSGVGKETIKEQASSVSEYEYLFLKINALGPLKLQKELEPLLVKEMPGTGIIFVGSVGGGDRPFSECLPEEEGSKAYLDFRVTYYAMQNLRTSFHVVRFNPGAMDTNMFQKKHLKQDE